jgi:RNA polymerase sigma-70 factor, ECF subfamily
MQPHLEDGPGLTDVQLVGTAKQGDEEAFNELVRRHRNRCVNLATFILRDRGEAEEEAQNACLKAFQHIAEFHGDAEFSTWLLRIVENQCLMLIRQKRRAQFVRLDHSSSEHRNEPLQLATPDPDPEGELGHREVLRALQIEIRRVPPLLRKVLLMRDVEELSMSEVSLRLGITLAAAKSRLLRARLELRRRMLPHCSPTGAWTLMTRMAAPPDRVFHQRAQGGTGRSVPLSQN